MTQPSVPTLVGAVYLLMVGAVFTLWPALPVEIFRFPPSPEPWVRVVGILTIVIGLLAGEAGRSNDLPIVRASLVTRGFLVLSFLVLVLLSLAPPQLLLFAAVEAIVAGWTYLALRSVRAL